MTYIFNQEFIKNLCKRLPHCKKAEREQHGKTKLLISVIDKKFGVLLEFSEK